MSMAVGFLCCRSLAVVRTKVHLVLPRPDPYLASLGPCIAVRPLRRFARRLRRPSGSTIVSVQETGHPEGLVWTHWGFRGHGQQVAEGEITVRQREFAARVHDDGSCENGH